MAVAAAVCAFLLFRLVKSTHQNDWFAFAATVVFMALPVSLREASEVMLEFPCAGLHSGGCIAFVTWTGPIPGGGPTRSRSWPRPPYGPSSTRFSWDWFPSSSVFCGETGGCWPRNLWASSFLLALAVLALLKLSAPVHNAGVTQQFNSTRTLWPAIVHNVKIYGRDLEEQVGAVVASWLVLSIAAFLLIPALSRHNENHLYLACILALVPLLLPAANRDVRYLFFAIPAFIVLGFESLELVFKRLLPAQSVPALTVLVAVYLSLSQVYEDSRRPVRGTDHRQLAQALKARSPRRLVYLGENNWYLVVAMRYVNPDSRAIVIRGDKMDPVSSRPKDSNALRDAMAWTPLCSSRHLTLTPGTSFWCTRRRAWCAIESCRPRRTSRRKSRSSTSRIRRASPSRLLKFPSVTRATP